MTLDLAFFHANPSGQLVSRVVNDVNVMRLAMTETLTNFGKNFMTFLFLAAVMFYQEWQLALAAFLILPLSAFFIAYIGKRLRALSNTTQLEMGVLSDRLSQTFQGIRQVKAYGMEHHEQASADIAINKIRKLNIKSNRVANMLTPVNEILVGMVISGLIMYGGYQVTGGDMTKGQLISFLTAFGLAYEPIKRLARGNNMLQMGLGASERVMAMLDLEPAIKTHAEAIQFQAKSPAIEFRNVEFYYENTELKALHDISFQATPGKVTALVGRSGAGKSTIMNLILRFYDVTQGSVIINGHDVRHYALGSLRQNVALVSQDITIFDDTILSNIAYGRLGASEDDVIAAARAASAHDFIAALPDGYATRVGEDGVKLSGGQKQRISIARAILRDAPILLLDEATSALDNESEKAVQEALRALEKGRTTIVIAHRLSTVQQADQIIVMDHGRIAEQGRHDELMARNGLYAHMYKAGLKDVD
jgi:subfamily B ATP-binding cassette protein MsbA